MFTTTPIYRGSKGRAILGVAKTSECDKNYLTQPNQPASKREIEKLKLEEKCKQIVSQIVKNQQLQKEANFESLTGNESEVLKARRIQNFQISDTNTIGQNVPVKI